MVNITRVKPAVSKGRRPRRCADAFSSMLRAAGDGVAPGLLAPAFEIGIRDVDAALMGAVDDWAAIDHAADVIDEPAGESPAP